MTDRERIDCDGWCPGRRIDRAALSRLAAIVDLHLVEATREGRRTGGARGLLGTDLTAWLREQGLLARAEELAGGPVAPTQALVHRKDPSHDWAVPWHQDRQVMRRSDGTKTAPGDDVLRRMLTCRVHLDAATETTGALEILEGSHARTWDRPCEQVVPGATARLLSMPAGGVLWMRPLLVHRSARCSEPALRRVLHVEFSAVRDLGADHGDVHR